MSLGLVTAAAAGLGLPRAVWLATLFAGVVLGAIALVEQILEPRRRKAEREAFEHLEYLHLTGSLTVPWLFDVFRDGPSDEGLRRATGIVAAWAMRVGDALAVAAPRKRFSFLNDQGGVAPSYRGLTTDQSVIVGVLERHLARLATIIDEAQREGRS